MIVCNGVLPSCPLKLYFIGIQKNSELNLHEFLLIECIYLLMNICNVLLVFVFDIYISAYWYISDYHFKLKYVGTFIPKLCN